MKKYRKLFGSLIPHNEGEWIRTQDLVDILFPRAYKDNSEGSRAMREILENEIWKSDSRTVVEVRRQMGKEKKPFVPVYMYRSIDNNENASDFFAFIYQALLDKEKRYKDNYKFLLSTTRRWLSLKYKEWLQKNGEKAA